MLRWTYIIDISGSFTLYTLKKYLPTREQTLTNFEFGK